MHLLKYLCCLLLRLTSDVVMDADALKDLDLSNYIAADKLAAMSDLEQRCCANRIRNYEMMKSIGNVLSS